jgi:P4 family phage/plasmid primase-like protien
MKSTRSSRGAASHGDAGHTNKAKGPVLKVHIGGKKPTEVNPAKLDAADWAELGKRCGRANGQVVLEIFSLHTWPDEARFSMLSMAHGLGARCRLQIRDKTYSDAFEAVLAAMRGPKSMQAHRQGFRAAVEAAALFHGEMPDAAAKRINDRLAEVGGAKMNHPSLVKQIREVAGATKANKQLDAHAAAQGFLAHLAEVGEADEDQCMLRYFQADFYAWNGNAWSRQEDKNFEAQVMAFLQTLKIPNVTARFAKDVIAHLAGMANLKCWEEPMPFMVATETPLKIDCPRLIVFDNGMIDLDDLIAGTTPKIKPADSTYFNEIVLPYNFAAKAKCPLWRKTLNDILPKVGDGDRRQRVLQEFFGYTLLETCRYQKMLVLHGDGGNGRSTITETWEALLGSENVADVPLEVLGAEFRLWSLKGKLANFSGELQYLGKMHEGLVKRVVSGEVIEANRKHKPPAKFRPCAKLIVNTNDMPQIQDTSDGTWDRLITIPFEVRVRGTPQEDKQRVEKLKAELPGIFNWAAEGLKRLLNQGHFTSCTKCAAFLAQHRTDCDTVRQFVSACCVKNPKAETYSEPLYEVYKLYTESTGRKPIAMPHFGRRMKGLKWVKGRASDPSRKPVYKGLGMTPTGVDCFGRWKRLAKQSDVDITHFAGTE